MLLITVVVEAADEQQARAACDALISRAGAQVVDARDCSDEEPGCWAVVITEPSAEKATHNGWPRCPGSVTSVPFGWRRRSRLPTSATRLLVPPNATAFSGPACTWMLPFDCPVFTSH